MMEKMTCYVKQPEETRGYLNKGKWEIYYRDWHGSDVRGVYDTEEACKAFYQMLKDEEDSHEAGL